MTTCPNQSLLQRFLRGDLSDEESDRVAAHTDECPACEAILGKIESQTDSLLERMGDAALKVNDHLDDEHFQRLRDKLLDLPTT